MTTLKDLPGGSGHEHADWLIGPVGQTRDSEALDRSNFEVTVSRMSAIDPEGLDHEVHRFGHWAVGWIEEIATRPNSPCCILAGNIKQQIDEYPVLDEMHLSQLEMEDDQ